MSRIFSETASFNESERDDTPGYIPDNMVYENAMLLKKVNDIISSVDEPVDGYNTRSVANKTAMSTIEKIKTLFKENRATERGRMDYIRQMDAMGIKDMMTTIFSTKPGVKSGILTSCIMYLAGRVFPEEIKNYGAWLAFHRLIYGSMSLIVLIEKPNIARLCRNEDGTVSYKCAALLHFIAMNVSYRIMKWYYFISRFRPSLEKWFIDFTATSKDLSVRVSDDYFGIMELYRKEFAKTRATGELTMEYVNSLVGTVFSIFSKESTLKSTMQSIIEEYHIEDVFTSINDATFDCMLNIIGFSLPKNTTSSTILRRIIDGDIAYTRLVDSEQIEQCIHLDAIGQKTNNTNTLVNKIYNRLSDRIQRNDKASNLLDLYKKRIESTIQIANLNYITSNQVFMRSIDFEYRFNKDWELYLTPYLPAFNAIAGNIGDSAMGAFDNIAERSTDGFQALFGMFSSENDDELADPDDQTGMVFISKSLEYGDGALFFILLSLLLYFTTTLVKRITCKPGNVNIRAKKSTKSRQSLKYIDDE
jgi:endonuclease III